MGVLTRAAVAGLILFSPARALATYSIVGANTETLEVGGAGTSCVGSSISVYVIYGSAVERGAVAAQAAHNRQGRDSAVQQLGQGVAPAQIIQSITSSGFDPGSSSRQYGIVDVQGRAAGFTGSTNGTFADDRQGTAGGYVYSTQGNILTSSAVLSQAAAAFQGGGCDLADRLMLALEAGAENGEGDRRCTDSRGIPSDGAFVQVDRPNEARGSYLSIRIDATGSQNPITRLRTQFNTWRQTHPCPDGGTGGTGGAGGSGGSGTGGSAGTAGSGGTGGASGAGGTGTSGTSGAGGGTSGTGAGGAAAGAGAGGGASAAGGSSGTGDASPEAGSRPEGPIQQAEPGCVCGLSARSRTPLLELLFAASLLLVRRRVRRGQLPPR